MLFFFFCKQKTAYEMRISDWSSDVCSSDLQFLVGFVERADHAFAQIPMNQSCRIHALPHYPDLFLSVLIRVNPWQKLLYPAHVGERLSRNAPRDRKSVV